MPGVARGHQMLATMGWYLQLFTVLLSVSVSTVLAREIEPCICSGQSMDCSFRERSVFGPGEVCWGTRKINLRGNYLSTMPDGMKKIVEIDISKNMLKILPDKSKISEKTRVLDVSSNQISATYNELTPMSSLEVLYVRENILKALDFLPQPCSLKTIDASHNSITRIDGPLQYCDILEKLILEHNEIVSLPEGIFSRFSQLEELDLRSNRLVQICSGLFDGLSTLKTLRLNSNKITSLPTGVFSKLVELTDLGLSQNSLTIIGPGVFDGLSQLQSLSLSVKKTTALPYKMFERTPQLLKLALLVNDLTTLPDEILKPLSALEKLDIAGTQLYELPEHFLSTTVNLKTLNIIGSQLRHLQDGFFAGLHALSVVDLRGNRLRVFPNFRNCCEQMCFTDLSRNNITDLTEAAVRELLRTETTVRLRDNPLRPESLRWAVMAPDLQHFVEDADCACGGLRRDNAVVNFCVQAKCNRGADFQDWVSAARGISPSAT